MYQKCWSDILYLQMTITFTEANIMLERQHNKELNLESEDLNSSLSFAIKDL